MSVSQYVEHAPDGTITYRQVVDLDERTVTVEVDGVVVEQRALTDAEYAAATYTPPPTAEERIAALETELAATKAALAAAELVTDSDIERERSKLEPVDDEPIRQR